jgi:hypothetical protein
LGPQANETFGDESDGRLLRQLTSIQRSLSQAFKSDQPVEALLDRLQSVVGATVAIVSPEGVADMATGPSPVKAIHGQLSATDAQTQSIDLDGWHGVAERLTSSDPDLPHAGWLVAVSRRDGFPDERSRAATTLGGTLVEAALRIGARAHHQETAIRAALLDQALALEPVREDAELSSRMSSLGLDFGRPLRLFVASPVTMLGAASRFMTMQEIRQRLSAALKGTGVRYFDSLREDALIVLANIDLPRLRTVLKDHRAEGMPLHVGIGRAVQNVGDIADSYADARLAIRMLRSRKSGPSTMSFEQFDLANRLFSTVGSARATQWSTQFLAPIMDKPGLLEAVRTYFDQQQNVNAAARILGVHPNSVRYRMSRVEELLELDLKAPAAIASLFLAVTSVDLDRDHQEEIRRTTKARRPQGVGAASSDQGEPDLGGNHAGSDNDFVVSFDPSDAADS